MNYELYKFGTLYLDGAPQPEIKWNGQAPALGDQKAITIGHSIEGHLLNWVRPAGMDILVSLNTLLVNVAYTQLSAAGYVEGRLVDIGELRFRCRLMTVGESSDADETNEWDQCLKRTRGQSVPWGWKDIGFWGLEKAKNSEGYAVFRGVHSAKARLFTGEDKRHRNVGFRPVLEPLVPFALRSGKVVELDGQEFCLRQESEPQFNMDTVQFRPTLYALLPKLYGVDEGERRSVDPEPLRGASKMRAYTLLMDGKPVRQDTKKAPQYKPGAKLELTDRFYGERHLIPWNIRHSYAEPVRELLSGVPYAELVEQGLARLPEAITEDDYWNGLGLR